MIPLVLRTNNGDINGSVSIGSAHGDLEELKDRWVEMTCQALRKVRLEP